MTEIRGETFLMDEMRAAQSNGCVGHVLVSETDRVRVWTIHLRPGERIGFHRHVLDYFWLCHTKGRSLSHHEDGTAVEAEYQPGDVRQHVYPEGKHKIHDLTNIGDTDLLFTTVEFLDSANAPLPIPGAIRQAALSG